jgi:uncharacterized protein YndB with AHSA1/START domain
MSGNEAVKGADSSGDREINTIRTFDASRELVWKMWTEAQHIKHWWGPRGFTTTIESMDVRPGGIWKLVMHGPDGTNYPNKIVYLDVDPMNRLVYENSGGKQGGPAAKFRSTITFSDKGTGTEVSVRMEFETAELRNKIADEYGAVQGLQQTLDRLGEILDQNQ